jgi:hypothetical protein
LTDILTVQYTMNNLMCMILLYDFTLKNIILPQMIFHDFLSEC